MMWREAATEQDKQDWKRCGVRGREQRHFKALGAKHVQVPPAAHTAAVMRQSNDGQLEGSSFKAETISRASPAAA
jgi:hypothetical protein